jgi:hypothetical protein
MNSFDVWCHTTDNMRKLTTVLSLDSSSPSFSQDTAWLAEVRGPGRGGVWRRSGCECPHVISCMNSYIYWIHLFCEFSLLTDILFYTNSVNSYIKLSIEILWNHLEIVLQKKLKSRWIHRYLAKFLVLQHMYLVRKGDCQKSIKKCLKKQHSATTLLL